MATHEVYVAEYDCATPVVIDGTKVYHQKGDGPSSCKACQRYCERQEREERAGRAR